MDPANLRAFLRHAEHSGVFHLPTSGVEAMRAAALANDMAFHHANVAEAAKANLAMERIGKDIGLPDYFGSNFDALYDCLTDLGWQETASSVIVISGTDTLYSGDPQGWATLLSVLGSAAEFWREQEIPFWVFIDMSADGIAHFPTLA